MSRSSDPGPFKKILVCQLRQIGDVILATPAVHLLKQAWPDAEIHFYTEKKCVPVLENNPDIANIWAVDKKELNTIFKQVAFYWKVASQGFDLVVDFQQLPRCRWVVGFSQLHGTKVRLSYTPPWYNKWLFTDSIDMKGGYAAMSKASVLRALGLEWNGEPPRVYLTDDEKAWAQDYLAQQGISKQHQIVTVDPTHRRATRRWPAEHFARLMDLAAEQNPDIRFLLLYGPGEEKDVQDIAGMVQHRQAVVIPDSLLSLREMAAVIEKATLHLGNCSSPRHFAVAVGTPTLTTLGSTSSSWSFPSDDHKAMALGLDCQPCNDNTCPRGTCECLTGLTPEMVLPELLKRLS